MDQNLISQVENQLAGLPKTELKPSKIGDENTFISARNGNTIINSHQIDIANALKVVMLKVGLRAANFPDELEKTVLIDHLIKNYGNHTTSEVLLAFDMAMGDKLGLENSEVVCYENFSCLYFSKIMNAYRNWATQVHRQLTGVSNLLDEYKPTEDEKRKEMLSWIEEWKNMVQINFDMIPVVFYDFLYKEGLLKLSNEQKWGYTEKSKDQLKSIFQREMELNTHIDAQRDYIEFCKMETIGFTGKFKSMIINRAKKIAIKEYLENEKSNTDARSGQDTSNGI